VAELFTSEGLVGGACGACDRRHFPVATWCPWCGAPSPAEIVLSREGRLWSWTAVEAAPPGYAGTVPFGLGVVDLPADGLRVVTRLTEADPTALGEGQPMRFTVVDLDEGRTTWAFEPLPGAGG
jgi:uncharacterized OB-fold protein